MPVKDPKEVFLLLLSNARQGAERGTKIYQEISQLAQDPEIKDSLEARAFISNQVLQRLDRCFDLLGEKPVKTTGRIQDVFAEDFRKEFAEIQSPVAKRLYVLGKIIHFTQLRIGEYLVLTAAADLTGNYAVGVLVESCLADKLAYVERTTRMIRNIAEARIQERVAA